MMSLYDVILSFFVVFLNKARCHQEQYILNINVHTNTDMYTLMC